MELHESAVKKLHEWLGPDGRHFFRTLAKLYNGNVIPVIKINFKRRGIPAWPIHFREGMQVRNFLRSLPELENMSFDDMENNYDQYIKASMFETDEIIEENEDEIIEELYFRQESGDR